MTMASRRAPQKGSRGRPKRPSALHEKLEGVMPQRLARQAGVECASRPFFSIGKSETHDGFGGYLAVQEGSHFQGSQATPQTTDHTFDSYCRAGRRPLMKACLVDGPEVDRPTTIF